MESHGGDVELVGVEDGVAKLELVGHCKGCPASEATLETAIQTAIEEAAPDLDGLEVEGVIEPAPAPAPTGFELPVLQRQRVGRARRRGRSSRPTCRPPARPRRSTVAGADLLVANVGGTLLAYRNACGVCGARLDGAPMTPGGTLTCPACERRFELRHAGRSPDDEQLQIPPVPLLRGEGRVRGGGRLMAGPRPALVAGLRRFAREPPRAQPPPAGRGEGGRCELCPISLADDHKHLLDLEERRIVCVCPTCWSMRSGEARYRPTGSRTLWLEGLELSDEQWAAFQIPIGLAFFLRSTETGRVVGLYPSPAGATECELDLDAWDRLVAANPVLEDLDPDAEALIVNRMADPHVHAIAPLDDCYRLVGIIKATWEGITGGAEMEAAVQRYFDGLRATAKVR